MLAELAVLSAMLGEFEEARELNERARLLFVERMRVRRPLMFLAQSNVAVERSYSPEISLRPGENCARRRLQSLRDGAMPTSRRYPPEIRERAVRLVFEHEKDYPSQWVAICSIAQKSARPRRPLDSGSGKQSVTAAGETA